MSCVLWQWRWRWFACTKLLRLQGSRRCQICQCWGVIFHPNQCRKFVGLFLCLSNTPKVWWSELHAPRGCCSFFVGGVGGKSLSRIPSFEAVTQKALRAHFWPFQKKLSSAHSIRSCPSSEGTTWVPCEKGSHSELHVSKKRTKFTGTFRRFLGTTTKICQGFFISQTLKNASFAPWKNWQLATGKSPSSIGNTSTHSGSIFQPAAFVTLGFSPRKNTPGNEVII